MSEVLTMPGAWPAEPSVPIITDDALPEAVTPTQASFAGGSPSDFDTFGYPPPYSVELPADSITHEASDPSEHNPNLSGRDAYPQRQSSGNMGDVARGNGNGKDPIIIAVFGQTGTGKTSFIKAVTKQDLKVGHSLTSCTEEVLAVHFKIGQQDVTLVDTPGFSDTNLSDTEILRRIAIWMKDTYDDGSLLSGIIYLHRISDRRMEGPSLKNLRMMKKLCGSDSLQNVVLATTMWQDVSVEDGLSRENELKTNFWKDMIAGGATVTRIGTDTTSSAVDVVTGMLANKPRATLLQQQLKDGKSLSETDAGTEIRQEFSRLEAKLRQELLEARAEMEIANRRRDRETERQLRDEMAQVNQKIARLEEEKELLERSTPRSLPKVKRQGFFGIMGYKCGGCDKRTNQQGRWTCGGCGHKQRNLW